MEIDFFIVIFIIEETSESSFVIFLLNSGISRKRLIKSMLKIFLFTVIILKSLNVYLVINSSINAKYAFYKQIKNRVFYQVHITYMI